MSKRFSTLVALLFALSLFGVTHAQTVEQFESDRIETAGGELKITFIGHGSLLFTFGGKVIHVDPDSRLADYSKLPKADLVLVTHEHKDHCDPKALEAIATEKTILVTNEACGAAMKHRVVMRNGEAKTVEGMPIRAVPAYNLAHMRSEGVPFHPKGVGNGYVVEFGDKKVYVAGDTENIPEMKTLEGIDVAFLPMNLPYTMTPEMVAAAATSFNPKILYPYHFGDTDTSKIVALLKGTSIDVRIRKMK
ncbi:MAG: MBL fold metallo-hydrolase [Syntrophobacteraceae bacterium]